MSLTFCMAPRADELCATVDLELPHDHSTQQLTARHRVTKLATDSEGRVIVTVDITDPATARPVDVRFDVVPADKDLGHRSLLVGTISRERQDWNVYGTYLGPVADEN